MKFLCLFHFRDDAFAGVTPREMRRIDDATIEHDQRMRQSGHLIFGSPLTGPEEGAAIDRRRRLDAAVIDGPFPEAKEVVGGFVLLEARDMDDALAVFADDPIARYARLEIRPLRNSDSDRHSKTGEGRPDIKLT
ncbi:MAG: YciI family protein [Devosia sp.]|uniref:YciI family protein n=1 Tax=Devosia sp. TaxID=1871048 RepID=UPI0024C9F5DE|nr:YciI family protein [Devosia sp.]UYN99996.1 MAG: YciI family protein [Devosia sp.]